MNKNQIAKKYSRALLNTTEVSDIPKIIEELRTFSRLVHIDKKLKLLFVSRIFSEDEKDKALKILLTYLKASIQTKKFLRIIIMQGHLTAIKEIIEASNTAYNEKLKKMTAMVISSVALGKNHVDRLKNVLKTLTRRDINIESQIDPSLLGGFVVKVGSTVYDSSLRGQLDLLKTELTR